jgi:hypothetical protein
MKDKSSTIIMGLDLGIERSEMDRSGLDVLRRVRPEGSIQSHGMIANN